MVNPDTLWEYRPCYAGFINDDLIIAGGCNFPDIPASEGGEKRFYKGIYRGLPANDSTLTWTQIGELPVEAAYGVTLSLPHKLIFVGGNHSTGRTFYHLLFVIEWPQATLLFLTHCPRYLLL